RGARGPGGSRVVGDAGVYRRDELRVEPRVRRLCDRRAHRPRFVWVGRAGPTRRDAARGARTTRAAPVRRGRVGRWAPTPADQRERQPDHPVLAGRADVEGARARQRGDAHGLGRGGGVDVERKRMGARVMNRILLALVVLLLAGCPRTTPAPPSGHVGAIAAPGTVPASWSQPFFCVDPGNVSTCASDTANSGASCGCTVAGGGPMSSWGGVEAPYGTNKPFLHQFTQYEFLSNDTTLLHPIDFEPTLDGSVQAPEMFAPLPTGTTTTIAAITAGTRTNTNTNWIASPTTGSFAAGTFIVNTTHRGAGWAWKPQSGASWHLSQPMARTLNPPVCLTRPGEVTTWAAGDTITYYSDLVHVNIVKLLPTIANMATNESTLINVHGVRVTTPGPTVIDYLTANQAVTFQEARSDRVIDWLNN